MDQCVQRFAGGYRSDHGHLKLADPLSADVRQIQSSKLRFGYDGAFNVLGEPPR
jgi:hypothetical protein